MSGDYEVGKGKPPKSGQWPEGVSGNPSGSSKKARERAKKARELKQKKPFEEMLVEELCESIAANVDGSKQEMLTARGMAKALVRDGLGGKAVDRRLAIKLFEALGVFELLSAKSKEAEFDEHALTPAEERMLERVRAEHEFMQTQPDRGDGWVLGYYDLESYVTDSGETETRIVPGPAYKAMKAAQAREEDQSTGSATNNAGETAKEVLLGRTGSIPLDDDPLPPKGDPDFDDDGDAGDEAGFDKSEDQAAGEGAKESGPRPNETFVDYSNVPGKGPSPAKSLPHNHQPDADRWPGWK